MKNEQPTHLDLFSGIGGFALAAQWAGFRTIGFCEIDKYCQKVLAKNFPNVPIIAEICDLLCVLTSSKPLHSETLLSAMQRSLQGDSQGTVSTAEQSELFPEALPSVGGGSVQGSAAGTQCAATMEQTQVEVNGCAGKAIQTGSTAMGIQSGKLSNLPNGEGAYSQETSTFARNASSRQKVKGNSTHITSNRGRNSQSTDLKLIMDLLYASHATRGYTVNLLTAGFPCQPYSVAGKRRGKDDDRALWPPLFEIIGLVRPLVCLLENVPGIIPMELDNVLSDLESIGYATRPFVIPACAVDARHRRDRLWIVGHCVEQRLEGCYRPFDLELQGRTKPIRPIREAGSQVADAYGEHGKELQRRNQLAEAIGETSLGRSDERAGRKWLPEPDVGGAFDGLSRWLDGHRGLNGEATRNVGTKMLCSLWDRIVSQAIQWSIRGCVTVSPEAVLLAALCKQKGWNVNEARLLVEGEKASKASMRGMWFASSTNCPSCGSGHNEQQSFEHSDALQALSRLLARDCEKMWIKHRRENASTLELGWETGFARVAHGVRSRVDRLKGLGNAIVPQVAYEIMREIRKLC